MTFGSSYEPGYQGLQSHKRVRAAARLHVLVRTLVLQPNQCDFPTTATIMGSVGTHKLEGPPLGFIALDIHFTRPPGDPWNEETWPFPLLREYAEGSKEEQIVTRGKYDDAFLERFAAAGKRLADRGCVGIITSCGFLAMAQAEYAILSPVCMSRRTNFAA